MSFCMAPFVHMVQNPDGQFRTCCMYEKPLKGNYKDIKDAFDSKENKIIRERMLSGEQLPECKKCDIDEMHNGKRKVSYRQEFNERYEKKYIDNPTFKNLEISVSNKCNFKCVDCGPRFSNQFGKTIINELPNFRYFKDLNHLKILGGEPFLDKNNFKLLSQIHRQNVNLFLVTNNSIFPREEFLNLLLDFNHVKLNISIDGVKDVAEYVRFGTKWTKFEKNWYKWFEWHSDKKRKVYLIPHFVMHSLNAPFFEEAIDWSNIEFINWSWDFLMEPSWLNMSYLPDKIKKYILDENKKIENDFQNPLSKYLYSNSYDEQNFKQLKKYILSRNTPSSMETYIDLFF